MSVLRAAIAVQRVFGRRSSSGFGMRTKSQLHDTLARSTRGTPNSVREGVRGRGVRRIGSEGVVPNTPSYRGMVKKVLHRVKVQQIEYHPSQAPQKV